MKYKTIAAHEVQDKSSTLSAGTEGQDKSASTQSQNIKQQHIKYNPIAAYKVQDNCSTGATKQHQQLVKCETMGRWQHINARQQHHMKNQTKRPYAVQGYCSTQKCKSTSTHNVQAIAAHGKGDNNSR